MIRFSVLGVSVSALALAGCGDARPPAAPAVAVAAPAAPAAKGSGVVAAERAKLPAEDRVLVEAQEWCAVSADERLGAMGPPLKLDVKGQPVFVCCKGCQRKALADPDATLAKVAESKAKKAAESPR